MKQNPIEQSYYDFIQQNTYDASNEQLNIVKKMDEFLHIVHLEIQKEQKKNFLNKITDIFSSKTHEPDICAGLYIYGGVGRGKSMLMNIFHDNLDINNKMRVHFHEFMQNIHTQLKEARKNDINDPVRYIAKNIAEKTQFICFDELQITDITDAMVVGRLFDALIHHNVKFIITSNRIPNDLYKNGLNRQLFVPFIRKIENKFEVLKLDHETDYRALNITDIQKYFTPIDGTPKEHIAILWKILTDNHPPQELILINQSREIKIEKSYKTLAYIDFNEFCNKNYGVSDYLLIAKEFKIIIFDKIPRLTSEMRNQATRFRNFIDAIYEAQNTVYFIAETAPDHLYQQGDFSFEFERTISRIKELISIQ